MSLLWRLSRGAQGFVRLAVSDDDIICPEMGPKRRVLVWARPNHATVGAQLGASLSP